MPVYASSLRKRPSCIKDCRPIDFFMGPLAALRVFTGRPCIKQAVDADGDVVFALTDEVGLLDWVADHLHTFGSLSTLIKGIMADAGITDVPRRLTLIEKARLLLQHLGRPADKVDIVIAALEEAEAKRKERAKRKQEAAEKKHAAQDDGEGANKEAPTTCKKVIKADGEEDEEKRNCDDDLGLSDADEDDGVESQDEGVDEDVEGAATAGQERTTLKMMAPPTWHEEAPAGCTLSRANATLSSSPYFIGRLPKGEAYNLSATCCKSFYCTEFELKRATLSEAEAQKHVCSWMWAWYRLSPSEKDLHRQEYKEHLETKSLFRGSGVGASLAAKSSSSSSSVTASSASSSTALPTKRPPAQSDAGGSSKKPRL
jgi:hypothetical protein